MAQHHFIKDLVRQMTNALLARYFQERRVLADFDFAAMREG
jgi:hypothetical protein